MLSIRSLSVFYSPDAATISGLDLDVREGEIFFLLGPSGCGKSTLLRTIAGFVRQRSGSIRLAGREIGVLPPEKRRAPMVFQNYALWPHLDVAGNVAFGLKLRGLSANQVRRETESILKTVGMLSFAKRRIHELSGGQQQRVALARALALNGDILLLDEPLSNLDAALRDRMRMEIKKICKKRNLTALYVTHDRKEALSIGDRIAVMRNGRIEQIGTPYELYHRPNSRFVASFLGDANFFPGRFLGEERGSLLFETPFGRIRAASEGQSALAPAIGGERLLTIRPEAIRLAPPDGSENVVAADIVGATFLGESFSFRCRAAEVSAEFFASESAGPERAPGTRVVCAFPPDRIRILGD